jgi:hypothetical protein
MSNIATTIEQSKHLLELGLDPKTADMFWMDTNSVKPCLKLMDDGIFNHRNYLVRFPNSSLPAWSLSALLEVMPKPDLYRETADLWVCATFFKEGSVRGFGETAIDAACDVITKMFGRGYLKKKGGEDGRN